MFVLFLLVQIAALSNVVPLETAPAPLQRLNSLLPLTAYADAVNRLVAGGEALREERPQLGREDRARELVGEDRRDADRRGRGHALDLEGVELLEERQVGVDRRFAQPVAAVGPAAVTEHPGEMAVEDEDKVHGRHASAMAARRRASARR